MSAKDRRGNTGPAPKSPTTTVHPGSAKPDNAGPLHSGPAGKQEIHKMSKTARQGIHGAKG